MRPFSASRDVFISHAREDRAVADQVCAVLERCGLRCWIAPRDVPPGRDWAETVVEGIEQAKALVLIFSEHANASPAVGSELEKAFGIGIPVFSFRIREVDPSKKIELFVRKWQWLDAFAPPIEQQIHQLAAAIHSVLDTQDATDDAVRDPGTDSATSPQLRAQEARPGGRHRRWIGAVAALCFIALAIAGAIWARVPNGGGQFEPEPPTPAFENSLGMKFVLIPPGGFRMGSPDSDADAADSEKPQHLVKITRPFYLGVYEVTQEQYTKVKGQNPSYHTSGTAGTSTENFPVKSLTWSDAAEFCRRLSEMEKRRYRLPTEAEWEYACRSGAATRFPNGDRLEDLQRIAVTAGEKVNPGRPMEVGSLERNAFGLYDMLGNVREFCADWYGNYSPDAQVDPQGPSSGEQHVVRGGCFHFRWQDARCASRFPVEGPASNVGFRVVLEP